MQRKQTILQQNDILDIVEGLQDTFPKCSIKDISTVEEYLFNCKLGKDFYKELQEALCTEECVAFVPKTTYNKGTIVVYKGVRKIALENTDTIPSTKVKWENAPKFCGDKADCFNAFWCDYLRTYLAWHVMANKAMSMGSRFEDDGSHVNVYDSNTSVPASDKALSRKTKYYWSQVKMSWTNMVAYAEGKECLSNFCKFETAARPKPRIRTRSRRWH